MLKQHLQCFGENCFYFCKNQLLIKQTQIYFLEKQFNMNKKKKIKKTYVAPTLKIFTVELENMISISSYTVRSGGPGNEPRIEEWDTKTDNKFKNFDL